MQYDELIQLLKTTDDVWQINQHREEIAEWLPKVRTMFEYDQQNAAHQYDLWMHCVHTVVGMPRNLEDSMLYLAALLHDIGKPDCQVKGKRPDDKDMHYYGHPLRSREIVETEVIPFLLEKGADLSEEDRKRLIYYVEHHDDRMSLRLKHVREHMNIPVTFETFQKLMLLEVSDALAHVQIPVVAERVQICSALAGEEGRKLYKQL
ncbi:MAG: HD domain-containing protein [Lachnospiraceae bacterium]|nr:HD domain-containing protein [Lachnospiraceae bacterium]